MATTTSEYTGTSCGILDVSCHLSSFATWISEKLLFIPRKTYEWLTDGIAALAGAIDLSIDTTALGGIPAGVSWFADLTAAPEGFAIVLSALVARFALKLIPTLGF